MHTVDEPVKFEEVLAVNEQIEGGSILTIAHLDMLDPRSVHQRKNNHLENAIEQLKLHIEEQNRLATLHILSSVFATSISLLMLMYMSVHPLDASNGSLSVWVHFLPRLSMVICLEVLSVYFLFLYREDRRHIRQRQEALIKDISAQAIHEAAMILVSDTRLSILASLLGSKEVQEKLSDKGNDEFQTVISKLVSVVTKTVKPGA